jgi:hypothetical protein
MKLEDAQRQLKAWEDASLALSTGKSYTMGNRTLLRSDITEVLKAIQFFTVEVEKAKRNLRVNNRVFRIVPRDY